MWRGKKEAGKSGQTLESKDIEQNDTGEEGQDEDEELSVVVNADAVPDPWAVAATEEPVGKRESGRGGAVSVRREAGGKETDWSNRAVHLLSIRQCFERRGFLA